MEITENTIYFSQNELLPQEFSLEDIFRVHQKLYLKLMEDITKMIGHITFEAKVTFRQPALTQEGRQQLFVTAFVNPKERQR